MPSWPLQWVRQLFDYPSYTMQTGSPLSMIAGTMPGISRQLKDLEQEIGVQIFVRTTALYASFLVAASVLAVPIRDHACYAPEELAEIAAALGLNASAHDSVEEAIATVSPGARVLIFGSLYLAGQVLAANDEIPN